MTIKENTPEVKDHKAGPPPTRGKYYIAPDISDEDLELRYAEHHEKNPLQTAIVVNKERATTVITSHVLEKDGNRKAQEVVLDHPRPAGEVRDCNSVDDKLDIEKLVDEKSKTPEPTYQGNTQKGDPLAKMTKYHRKRLTSLSREKESMLKKCEKLIAEQKGLVSPSIEVDTKADDLGARRRNILFEMKAFDLGVQSVRWEKKKAALEENIAFAATPEGIALEELRKKEKADKEKQKRRAKKTKASDKLGRYSVLVGEESEGRGNWEGRGREKGKFGGNDSHRVVKKDGEGRWGGGRPRGGRGGRRGRDRGGKRDANDGPGWRN